jgi:hypothetical protein
MYAPCYTCPGFIMPTVMWYMVASWCLPLEVIVFCLLLLNLSPILKRISTLTQ